MTEIFIEWQRADVSGELSSLLTFTVDDVRDFTGKNTSFSKTIVLPGTARNNRLFGHIFDVRQANSYNDGERNIGYNFNAAKSARAVIMQDQIQQFKGILRLMEVIIDRDSVEYEVAVFGELSGLVLKMGNKKLSDLDMSANDHTFSTANITASWDNANAGSGYYYPLIDYGLTSTDKANWKVNTFRPAMFAKEYLEKIFAAAGYTFECDLFNTDRFKRWIVPYNRKVLTSLNTNALTAAISTQQVVIVDFDGAAFVSFDTVTTSFFTYPVNNTVFTFTPSTSARVSIAFRLVGSYIATGSAWFSFTLFKNSTPLYNQVYSASSGIVGVTIDETIITTFNQNDTFSFYVEGQGTLSIGDNFTIDSMSLQVLFQVSQQVPVNIGDTVLANDCIPQNILQKEFFSSIVKLFNLYVYDDINKENHVIIKPYIDFYSVTDEGEDYTFRLDEGRPVRIKPMSELNARYYEFKFKQDSDYYNELYRKRYNEGYGDRVFDSEFEFANENETVELIFSSTPLVGYSGEDKVYPTIFKLNNEVEEQMDSNIRIMQAAKVTGVTSWNILAASGVTVISSGLTSYGYAGHLDNPDAPSNDLNFGVPAELFFTLVSGDITVNQFNVYWSPYMAEITDKDSKLLTAYFKFNPADIYNLDFSRYVYLHGTLWRISKIEDYNPAEPGTCKVELLKVAFKEY